MDGTGVGVGSASTRGAGVASSESIAVVGPSAPRAPSRVAGLGPAGPARDVPIVSGLPSGPAWIMDAPGSGSTVPSGSRSRVSGSSIGGPPAGKQEWGHTPLRAVNLMSVLYDSSPRPPRG